MVVKLTFVIVLGYNSGPERDKVFLLRHYSSIVFISIIASKKGSTNNTISKRIMVVNVNFVFVADHNNGLRHISSSSLE